jgi:hypothetical protein
VQLSEVTEKMERFWTDLFVESKPMTAKVASKTLHALLNASQRCLAPGESRSKGLLEDLARYLGQVGARGIPASLDETEAAPPPHRNFASIAEKTLPLMVKGVVEACAARCDA